VTKPPLGSHPRPQWTLLLDDPAVTREDRVDRFVEAVGREGPGIGVVVAEMETDAVSGEK